MTQPNDYDLPNDFDLPNDYELNDSEAKRVHQHFERLLYELKKVVVGQETFLEKLLVALLAQGHVLVEGPPGLAKTLTLKSLAESLALSFQRIQFTPDLLPADLIGTRIFSPGTGMFTTELGPILANFILADEINRAPAKVQSALLEAMQEKQVTLGKETFTLPSPFLVMATQNPLESEGTYPLPEAQLDRFLFKLVVDYPTQQEELVILQRVTETGLPTLQALLEPAELMGMTRLSAQVYLDPKIAQYIVDLVQATRNIKPEWVQYGASPRGTLALAQSSKAYALMQARTYVTPEDVRYFVKDTLRHRVALTYDAMAQGVTLDSFLDQILQAIPVPTLASLA
jgi:MoxR-like ATPase